MNFFPITETHPLRKPYSGGARFRDNKPPAPLEFYDECQDHMAALYHMRLGWKWSGHREDFDNINYPSSYLGAFSYTALPVGSLSIAPLFPVNFQGEHGVWAISSSNANYDFTMSTAPCFVGTDDFLISAKFHVINRSHLDPVNTFGFWVGCGERIGPDAVVYPALCGGADQTNWQIWCPPADGEPGAFFDTGVVFQDSTTLSDNYQRAWHVLQISRVDGVVRFFINGALVRINGNGITNAEGIYYPANMRRLQRWFRTRRWFVGAANEGCYVDFFHRFARRG